MTKIQRVLKDHFVLEPSVNPRSLSWAFILRILCRQDLAGAEISELLEIRHRHVTFMLQHFDELCDLMWNVLPAEKPVRSTLEGRKAPYTSTVRE